MLVFHSGLGSVEQLVISPANQFIACAKPGARPTVCKPFINDKPIRVKRPKEYVSYEPPIHFKGSDLFLIYNNQYCSVDIDTGKQRVIMSYCGHSRFAFSTISNGFQYLLVSSRLEDDATYHIELFSLKDPLQPFHMWSVLGIEIDWDRVGFIQNTETIVICNNNFSSGCLSRPIYILGYILGSSFTEDGVLARSGNVAASRHAQRAVFLWL